MQYNSQSEDSLQRFNDQMQIMRNIIQKESQLRKIEEFMLLKDPLKILFDIATSSRFMKSMKRYHIPIKRKVIEFMRSIMPDRIAHRLKREQVFNRARKQVGDIHPESQDTMFVEEMDVIEIRQEEVYDAPPAAYKYYLVRESRENSMQETKPHLISEKLRPQIKILQESIYSMYPRLVLARIVYEEDRRRDEEGKVREIFSSVVYIPKDLTQYGIEPNPGPPPRTLYQGRNKSVLRHVSPLRAITSNQYAVKSFQMCVNDLDPAIYDQPMMGSFRYSDYYTTYLNDYVVMDLVFSNIDVSSIVTVGVIISLEDMSVTVSDIFEARRAIKDSVITAQVHPNKRRRIRRKNIMKLVDPIYYEDDVSYRGHYNKNPIKPVYINIVMFSTTSEIVNLDVKFRFQLMSRWSNHLEVNRDNQLRELSLDERAIATKNMNAWIYHLQTNRVVYSNRSGAMVAHYATNESLVRYVNRDLDLYQTQEENDQELYVRSSMYDSSDIRNGRFIGYEYQSDRQRDDARVVQKTRYRTEEELYGYRGDEDDTPQVSGETTPLSRDSSGSL